MTDAVVEVTDKNNHFTFSVKAKFLENCPNPNDLDMEALAVTHKFHEFLHNPNGVALQCNIKGKEKTRVYVLEGKYISDPKVIESIESKKQFNETFNDLIK